MRKLTAFNFISLNGCFKGPNGDLGWHRHGTEEGEYAAGNLGPGSNILLFGRVTYEMMAGYWPSPMALESNWAVAEGMNNADKIVFSRTLESASWSNTRLISENVCEEIRKMKQSAGKDMTILGSGSIITLFSEQGLIDGYEIMVDPVVITGGTPVFNGIRQNLNLTLTGSKTFKSGVVLLAYEPAEINRLTPHI